MNITELQKKTIDLLNPWWRGFEVELGIERSDYLKEIEKIVRDRQEILFVIGSRRVGKTRILFQFIYKLIKEGIKPNDILFLSLDNSNLEKVDWYSYITESKFRYVFLDEVQYSLKWAQILKSLYDLPNKNYKIICSGSSSNLIEDKKAFLTGRTTSLLVTPLDFSEFKKFTNNADVKDYLFYGGYPEYVLEKEPSYLNDLARDIVEKDIVKIHKVRNKQYLYDLCQILAKQIGFKGSSNKIASVLKIDNKTVENYIQYLKEVKLIDIVYQYSESLNKKLFSPKKYYFNDLGMRNNFVGFSDFGSLVENAVFLKLSKTYGSNNVYYLSDTRANEVDFLVRLPNNEAILVESKYKDLENVAINSISGLFFKEIHDIKIIKRIVVTNGINTNFKKGNVTLELVSLENFLQIKYV